MQLIHSLAGASCLPLAEHRNRPPAGAPVFLLTSQSPSSAGLKMHGIIGSGIYMIEKGLERYVLNMDDGTFDSLFSSGRLQMLKVLLPCLPEDKRGTLAIYIRMQEFLHTLGFVSRAKNSIPMPPPPEGEALVDALLPYCDPEQERQLRSFRQTLHQMDHLKEMMEMAQMMQELFPDGMNAENMDFSQMSTMFSQFQEAYGSSSDQKMEDANGTMDGGRTRPDNS